MPLGRYKKIKPGFEPLMILIHNKGPFKYYVSKRVGGWVRPYAYVFLHGGWVGSAKCLRNKKHHRKFSN